MSVNYSAAVEVIYVRGSQKQEGYRFLLSNQIPFFRRRDSSSLSRLPSLRGLRALQTVSHFLGNRGARAREKILLQIVFRADRKK